jgi:RimJ/RimL family protein N-acetyltransferase
MKLVDVYDDDASVDVLWHLLMERERHQSISHRTMPAMQEHKDFIASKPYQHWYLIDVGDYAGAIYISKQREIGISILREFRRNGYAKMAIGMIIDRHPGKFLANINPNNRDSIDLFTGLGFRLLQMTYAR